MAKGTSSSKGATPAKKTLWKGIQKKASSYTNNASAEPSKQSKEQRPASITSQESHKTMNSQKDQSSLKKDISRSSDEEEEFEDAVGDEEDEDEDDDYFQNEQEDQEELKKKKEFAKLKEKAIAQDKKRNNEKSDPIKVDPATTTTVSSTVSEEKEEEEEEEEEGEEEEAIVKKPTRMSFILPALQNHGYNSSSDENEDEDDKESLKDPSEKYNQEKQQQQQKSSADLIAEIEALEVGSSSTTTKPATNNVVKEDKEKEKEDEKSIIKADEEEEEEIVPEKSTSKSFEKPATYEPIPNQRAAYKAASVATTPTVIETTLSTPSTDTLAKVETPAIVKDDKEEEGKKPTMEDIQKEIMKSAAAVAAAATAASPSSAAIVATPPVETTSLAAEIHMVSKDTTDAHNGQQADSNEQDFKAMVENATDLNSSDSGISVSQDNTARSSSSTEQEEAPTVNHLAAILPAVEESAKGVKNGGIDREILTASIPPVKKVDLKPEDHERANCSREFEYSIEDPVDLDMFRDNVIAIQAINPKEIPANNLKPREQEAADEPVREGMKFLFDNKFMKAKSVFQTKASIDPLYALGLGAMAFIKAIMTYHESDIEIAMNALATAYTIAKTQIDNTSFKKPFKDTVSTYLSTLLSPNSTGLPTNPPAMAMPNSSGGIASPNAFIPNGVLRAHVVKAECCLLMGILQMIQESVVGYLKCGLNLRRAYNSYSIVWQEYKRMGQEYTKYMDRDTVSAIQFGIGAVHLILSSMPPKILKIFSTLGWKSDKQLGFALLKLCLEGRGIRAPLASLTLLAYYSVLTSFAPQLYSKDMMSPAIECLLDAQSHHPNSCFFLFFAARIARVARNLPLSTQSFTFASESSRGEWAEVAMKQMSDYEIGFNLALQLNWEGAAKYFDHLSQEKYWSPAFSQYFVGACYEMMGQRTESILAFAQVPQSTQQDANNKSGGGRTYIDSYVQKKVEFFQKSGYQDMDFSLPGLEIMLVLNAFEYMEKGNLEACLELVQRTLEMIYEREKVEYNIRLRELVPVTNPPDYYDQRAVLLLTKASILNSLGRYDETIAHLNWILDHKHCVKEETWVIPFTYWESGVTSWGLGNYTKSRKLWQLAMACTKYDFEYRMAVRLSLALSKCDEEGIPHIADKDIKGTSTNGRKRMPIISNSAATTTATSPTSF